MSEDWFPPDVRVRWVGDEEAARELFGRARRVLFKALQMQERSGSEITALSEDLTGGSKIQVLLYSGQKIVTLTARPPKPAPSEEFSEEYPSPEYQNPTEFSILSGWTRNHQIIDSALHEFYPSPADVTAYNMAEDWQDMAKLYGPPVPVITTVPSRYSGAMKRAVQSILGVGVIDNDQASYITGDVPDPTERMITVPYDYTWNTTHGIYKAGDKNHWLIEVSKTRGVLAMPLILFDFSKDPDYAAALASGGDTDTLKVVDEFGGVPTGESFPTLLADLNAAIAAGKVLQLAMPGDLDPFYVNRGAWTPYSGWAFAETLGEARNTCYTFIAKKTLKEGSFPKVGVGELAWLYSEHWKLNITLSEHDISQLDIPGGVIGTGSATLEKIHAGKLLGSVCATILAPTNSDQMILTPPALYQSQIQGYDNLSGMVPIDGVPLDGPKYQEGFGADIWVFYDGDRLERVKWCPAFTWDGSFGYVSFSYNTNHNYAGIWGASSLRTSPEAYVGVSIEPRVICQSGTALTGPSFSFSTDIPPIPYVVYINGVRLVIHSISEAESAYPPVSSASGLWGNWNSQAFWLLIPSFCREGYGIAVNEHTGTTSPQPYPASVISTISSNTWKTWGFFGGRVMLLGGATGGVKVDFPLTSLSTKTMFSVKLSARGTQWLMTDGFVDLTTSYRPTTRSGVPPGLEATLPAKMNWVGAPD